MMICTIFSYRVTVTIYEIWCVDDFCDFQLYRDTDVLWCMMSWWFLLFLTVERQWCFMKSDVLTIFTILNCRETVMFYEVWCVDDFYYFNLVFLTVDCRETDVLWSLMSWWFLLFKTVERHWRFMKSDELNLMILTIFDCRETVMVYGIFWLFLTVERQWWFMESDDFYDFWL